MIKVCRGRDGSGAKRIVFSLPVDAPSGCVSVVGSFNGWTPGRHHLQDRANGRRSAVVEVAAGVPVQFRYLGENGHWFDDPDDPQGLDRIAAPSPSP
ncbi:isoamylase [Amycolatopsis sp. PS_44_ISF1]|uniref:isoamylase n=1 Tax=Amycolatopsis sp. PS_44_ISF1 TaxID=2974917 RepID=UPI0028DD68C1|nr:isoamylase [Amycolatopsis sp. PS_44_ISF1]MDT8912280.1 isoamylase [Amycolatopsis sp. PS_44_ISF1]